MKLKTTDLCQFINNELEKLNVSLRIVDYCVNLCLLNSGLILGRLGFLQFRQRIHSKRYRHHLDVLYANNLIEGIALLKILRHENASHAAKIGMTKNGDQIIAQATKNLEVARKNGSCWLTPNPWFKGKNKNNCEQLRYLSESRKGVGNPMWGRRYSSEAKQIQSDALKQLILEGKFTPNICNSRTHRSAKWKDKSYRSTWEAAFATLHPSFIYEKIRIPYFLNGNQFVYIVDFIDLETKNLFEIKPACHVSSEKVMSKMNAANLWCVQNNSRFTIVTEDQLFNQWDKIKFDELDNHSGILLRKAYEAYTKKHYRNP